MGLKLPAALTLLSLMETRPRSESTRTASRGGGETVEIKETMTRDANRAVDGKSEQMVAEQDV